MYIQEIIKGQPDVQAFCIYVGFREGPYLKGWIVSSLIWLCQWLITRFEPTTFWLHGDNITVAHTLSFALEITEKVETTSKSIIIQQLFN